MEDVDGAVREQWALIDADPARYDCYHALLEIYAGAQWVDAATCVASTLAFLKKATPEALAWLAAVSEDAHDAPGAGAILFKGPKPGQDHRADLPAIGPATALRAAAAGLDGIVIQSGGVMVVHLALTVAILDAMDMFLWVRL